MQRLILFAITSLLTMPAMADVHLHHIELAVSQSDAARKWYVEHLPCQTVADRTERIICGGMQIDFIERQSMGSSQGTSVNHISFAYPDVAAKMQALEDVGVGGAGVRLQRFDDGSLVNDDQGIGVHGFIFDPWGTRIELIQAGAEPGFHHVHLYSADPDAARAWYAEALGAQPTAEGFTLAGKSFYLTLNPEGPPAGTRERAIDHLSLAVPDIDRLHQTLRDTGVQVSDPHTPAQARATARRSLLTGPDGVRLELVEPGWDGFTEAEAKVASAAKPRQPFATPRTPWGEPDLQGMWTGNAAHGIPLERPEDLDSNTVTAEQAAERREQGTLRSIWGYEREWRDTTLGYDRFQASRQAAMIIDPPDGRLPPMTHAGKLALERETERQARQLHAAGPEELSGWVRCITQGLPGMMMPGVYNNGLQIQQSPGYVAVQKEMIHETRIIPTSPKERSGIKQWLGSSRGHWQGDTLVIEVTDFNGRSTYQGASDRLKLTERYRLVDRDTLEYQFTIDDPTIWTAPWTGMFHFKRDEAQYELVEYACHEGNYAMRNLLSAARAKDRQAAAESGGD